MRWKVIWRRKEEILIDDILEFDVILQKIERN